MHHRETKQIEINFIDLQLTHPAEEKGKHVRSCPDLKRNKLSSQSRLLLSCNCEKHGKEQCVPDRSTARSSEGKCLPRHAQRRFHFPAPPSPDRSANSHPLERGGVDIRDGGAGAAAGGGPGERGDGVGGGGTSSRCGEMSRIIFNAKNTVVFSKRKNKRTL